MFIITVVFTLVSLLTLYSSIYIPLYRNAISIPKAREVDKQVQLKVIKKAEKKMKMGKEISIRDRIGRLFKPGLSLGNPSHVRYNKHGDIVPEGKYLLPNKCIKSKSSKYMAVMQSDGNFVLYNVDDMSELWSSKTTTQQYYQHRLKMGYGDEGLAIFHYIKKENLRNVWEVRPEPMDTKWWSGYHSVILHLNDAGRLSIIAKRGNDNRILWSVGSRSEVPNKTYLNAFGDYMGRMYVNQYIRSPNDRYYSLVRPDGAFVLYEKNQLDDKGDKVLWSSNTSGTNVYVRYQQDGNLVIYDKSQPLWSTGTFGEFKYGRDHGKSWKTGSLNVTDEGRLELISVYKPSKFPVVTYSVGKIQCVGTYLINIGNEFARLMPNQYIKSPSERYMLIMRPNGNLAIRDVKNKSDIWKSKTDSGMSRLVCKNDGLTICSPNHFLFGDPVWSVDKLDGKYKVVMRDDGRAGIEMKGKFININTGTKKSGPKMKR